MWYWKNWTTTCKRMKLEHSQTPFTEIRQKKNLTINMKAQKTSNRQDNLEKEKWS